MRCRTRTRPRRCSTTCSIAARQAALRLLWKARHMAQEIHRSPWSLAVELEALIAEHVFPKDLRWLVNRGYAEHRIETTRRGSPERTFRPAGPALSVRSCFTLTERGMGAARRCGALERPALSRIGPISERPLARPKPRWDRQLRQLWVGKMLVKSFRVPAGNQEVILAAFQEQGWPPRIDDPLPRKECIDPKDRLRASIRRLNRGQLRALLRFRGDGTGKGLRWEIIFTDE